MKNYEQYINEDLRSKDISLDVSIVNLELLYPGIQVKYDDDLHVTISYTKGLNLNYAFYEALEKDRINKDDITFRNCDIIILNKIDEFKTISDYGAFGKNVNYFNCYGCKNLTSLQGAPEIIHGDFCCAKCGNLVNLDGAPYLVYGDFYCSNCENLTSLEGGPETVRDFYCFNCAKLINLDDAPDVVRDIFDCRKCNPNFIKLAKEKYGHKALI